SERQIRPATCWASNCTCSGRKSPPERRTQTLVTTRRNQLSHLLALDRPVREPHSNDSSAPLHPGDRAIGLRQDADTHLIQRTGLADLIERRVIGARARCDYPP